MDVVAFMMKQIYCGEGAFRTHWVRGWVDYRACFYIVVKRQILTPARIVLWRSSVAIQHVVRGKCEVAHSIKDHSLKNYGGVDT
jgi:hypothetical protein